MVQPPGSCSPRQSPWACSTAALSAPLASLWWSSPGLAPTTTSPPSSSTHTQTYPGRWWCLCWLSPCSRLSLCQRSTGHIHHSLLTRYRDTGCLTIALVLVCSCKSCFKIGLIISDILLSNSRLSLKTKSWLYFTPVTRRTTTRTTLTKIYQLGVY